eukprot:TRINITY_DN24170_c0_g1_i1.p1 TRINITY_DN24170_c0_g1~~TRINITY_DN24170_c0_g1_i1.p1  ORF type:complete len:809 (-),score=151.84 TRINITY_DN24170_c0_g1_i1:500-2779(-)
MVSFGSDGQVGEADAEVMPDSQPVDEADDKARSLPGTNPVKVRSSAASQKTYEQLITAMSMEFHRMQAEIEVLHRQNQMLLPGRSASEPVLNNNSAPRKQVIAPTAFRATGDVLPETVEKGADLSMSTALATIEEPEPLMAPDVVVSAATIAPARKVGMGSMGRKSVISSVITEKKARATIASVKKSVGTETDAGAHAMLAAQQAEAENLNSILAQTRQDQFKRLDSSCTGCLFPWDVVHAAQMLDTDLDEETVKLAFNFISNQQTNGSPGKADKTQDAQDEMGITFDQYLMVMNDEIYCGGSNIEVNHAVQLVKSFFFTEANDHRSKVILEAEKTRQQQKSMKSHMTVMLDIASVFVICIHSLVIGISVDVAPDDIFWQITEVIFFVYYLGEAVLKVKLFGFRTYWRGPDWMWNAFDVSCILLSCVDMAFTYKRSSGSDDAEMGHLMLVKMFRMARMTRIIRVMRFKMFKELKLIILGLFSGLRALVWAIVLLMVFIYILAILLVSFVGEKEVEFASVDAAMFTLFRCFTDGCASYTGTPLSERLRMRYGWLFFTMYILIMMMVTVGIFNLIMAVFIDNVTKSQQQRKQKELGESLEAVEAELKLQVARFILNPRMGDDDDKTLIQRLSDHARRQLASLTDEDGTRTHAAKLGSADAAFDVLTSEKVTISRDVFHSWLLDKDFVHVLEDADVDISNKFELFDILDVDMGGELSAEELINGLLKLRGDVSKGDIVAIMLKSIHMTRQIEEMMSSRKGEL